MNVDFDYFYKLEPELLYKFVDFDDEQDSKDEGEEEEEVVNVDTLNSNDTIKIDNSAENKEMDQTESERLIIGPNKVESTTNNSILRSSFSKDSKILNSKVVNSTITNSTILNSNISNSTIISSISKSLNISNSIMNSSISYKANDSLAVQNKFKEQVIPVRGYYNLQVFSSLMIELTDNAETYDGLVKNLDKIVDDEQMFLKPLHLIYLAKISNFNLYFGLNSTLNTSTSSLASSLTKNIQTITTNVLQNRTNLTNYEPLINLLNNTITKINLTSSLNASLQTSLENTLKNNLEIKKDLNSTLNGTLNNSMANKKQTLNQINNVSSINQMNLSVSKDNEKLNLTAAFKRLSQNNYTQIYIGNVDNNNTLSSLPAFVSIITQ